MRVRLRVRRSNIGNGGSTRSRVCREPQHAETKTRRRRWPIQSSSIIVWEADLFRSTGWVVRAHPPQATEWKDGKGLLHSWVRCVCCEGCFVHAAWPQPGCAGDAAVCAGNASEAAERADRTRVHGGGLLALCKAERAVPEAPGRPQGALHRERVHVVAGAGRARLLPKAQRPERLKRAQVKVKVMRLERTIRAVRAAILSPTRAHAHTRTLAHTHTIFVFPCFHQPPCTFSYLFVTSLSRARTLLSLQLSLHFIFYRYQNTHCTHTHSDNSKCSSSSNSGSGSRI